MDLKRHGLQPNRRELPTDSQREMLAIYARWLFERQQRGKFFAELTASIALAVGLALIVQVFGIALSAQLDIWFQAVGVIAFVLCSLLAASMWRAKVQASLSAMELLALRFELADLATDTEE